MMSSYRHLTARLIVTDEPRDPFSSSGWERLCASARLCATIKRSRVNLLTGKYGIWVLKWCILRVWSGGSNEIWWVSTPLYGNGAKMAPLYDPASTDYANKSSLQCEISPPRENQTLACTRFIFRKEDMRLKGIERALFSSTTERST